MVARKRNKPTEGKTRRVWRAFLSHYKKQGWCGEYCSKIYQHWKGAGYQNIYYGQQKRNDPLRFMHLVPFRYRCHALFMPQYYRTTRNPKKWDGLVPRE